MKGKVNAGREAVVRIRVLGRGKSRRTVNAVVDTVTLEIDESPCDPLIGMKLLEGYELNIRVKKNGAVSIRPLP